MDEGDFSPDAPGRLVFLREHQAHAFIPHALPPVLSDLTALLPAIEAARGAISELVGQSRLITALDLVMGALARREAIYSSRMEGTHTELLELLEHEAEADHPGSTSDEDLQEVLNDLESIGLADDWRRDGRDLGFPLVRDLHARLMRGVRGEDTHPGLFRQ